MIARLPDTQDVVQAVQRAGDLALAMGVQNARRKADGSWVTAADFAVADQLRDALSALLPSACLLDEERGGNLGDGHAWVVDPIDGTTNFRRGGDRWCVSVALLSEGRAVLGVVHQPSLGRTWAAGPDGPRFAASGPGNVGLLLGGRLSGVGRRWRQVVPAIWKGASVRITGSVALDLVDVACGRARSSISLGVRTWDWAAARFLVEACGGTVDTWRRGDCWDVVATHR